MQLLIFVWSLFFYFGSEMSTNSFVNRSFDLRLCVWPIYLFRSFLNLKTLYSQNTLFLTKHQLIVQFVAVNFS